MPSEQQPKTRLRKKKKEKTQKEKEVEGRVVMQKQKPFLPVDEVEFDKGLKPTSGFYAKSQKVAGEGDDDAGDDKDDDSDDKDDEVTS